MLKTIGTEARQEIEALPRARRSSSGLFVKVREDWRDSEGILDEMGLGESGGGESR